MQMIKQVDQAYLSVLFQNKEYKLGTLFAFLKILYFVPLWVLLVHPWALLWVEFLPLGLRAPRQSELSQLPTHLLQTFGEDQLYCSHFSGGAHEQ